MKIVLAEKPSVARSLAKVLGCYKKEDGYLYNNDYIVTWALGHLVELAQPAAYSDSYKRWSFASLPILPNELKRVPIERTKDQFKIVKSLIERDDIDCVIIATDAGREGELVARWILELSNYKKDVKRLWISSQTSQAIKEGFNNLKSGNDYINLYDAAQSRASADWYVGMNVTRALTTHYDAKISAGRVQTPTLFLICEREEEIEKFSGKFYWTIKGDFNQFNASYYHKEDTIRIESEDDLNQVTKILDANKSAKITKIEKLEKIEKQPLAYDLTELQRDANIKLGFSAKKTLDVLQRLYEYHKIVTYPRTDSRYISDDIVSGLESRLNALRPTSFIDKIAKIKKDGLCISDRFVRNDMVSDHHAIIPTEEKVKLDRLSEDEKSLWSLVVIRFLEVLSKEYIYASTTLYLNIDNLMFKTRVTEAKQYGFKDVLKDSINKDILDLNSFCEGQTILLSDYKITKLITDAPKRYTDATLLSAMEHAGRFVEEASLKKNLSAGLGTPATRADIIEKLIKNKYIIRSDENEFVPTSYAREIIRLVPDLLKSPALTGKWEERLKKISKGKEDKELFLNDIKILTKDLINNVKNSYETFAPTYKESKTCPYCDTAMMKVVDELNRVHFVCTKLSCSYEEMIVEKKVLLTKEELEKQPKKVVKKVKKVKVVAKENVEIKKATKASSSAAYFQNLSKKTPKTKATISKDVSQVEKYKTIKVVEVVRDSKKNRRKYNEKTKPIDNKYKYDSSSSGGSFADFIKASENRVKKRNKKR